MNPQPGDVAAARCDRFMLGTGPWDPGHGRTSTGIEDVDLWVGGLAEATNLNGGLLGSTFNYVFENQLSNLQSGDRLYYLNRTAGMNLLSQLEGNSFAEIISRNTEGTQALKADAFSTADCRFELAHLQGQGSTVADDPHDPVRREQAAPAQARRHDRLPHQQQRRPERRQRPGGVRRHAGHRPGHRRHRQRHLLGRCERRRHRRQQRQRRGLRRRRQRHGHRLRRRRHARGRTGRRRDRRRARHRPAARRRRSRTPSTAAPAATSSSADPAPTSSTPAPAPTPPRVTAATTGSRAAPARTRSPGTTRRRSSTIPAR